MARCLVVALWVLVGPGNFATAHAQQEFGLGPAPSRPFLSPDGSFATKVPASWLSRAFTRSKVVQFTVPGPGAAWLQVRRMHVPDGAKPKQLLLHSKEVRLSKLPHFRLFGVQDMAIGGRRAAVLQGDFWFQGNAEYPRGLEEMVIIDGNEAFEVHFECFEPMVESMRGQLMQFYGNFVTHPANDVAPPGGGGPDSADNLQDLMDRVPF